MTQRLLISGVLILLFGLLAGYAVSTNSEITGQDLIFSHKSHAEMEFDCLTCHSSVEESVAGSDNNLPDMDVCMVCHDGDTASEECEACHKDPDNAGTYPRVDSYHGLFAHKGHLGRGMECSTCHYGVTEVDIATVQNLPRMQVCMECHQADFRPQACEVCHEDYTELRPESHDYTWSTTHRETAKIDQNGCADCHSNDYCQSCHQGDNIDGSIHDLNYLYNHSLDAHAKEVDCMSCHESREFCSDCHRQELVMPVSHSKVSWTNLIPGDGGSHRMDAEEDLESCAACHESGEKDPVCAECHGSL